jgi:L-alanine-DL-glutamate epimerase-like enolase superfamily enzyme
MALPNAIIQEGVRAYYGSGGWYHDVVTTLPHAEHGTVRAPDGPGLGMALLPDFAARDDVQVRATNA